MPDNGLSDNKPAFIFVHGPWHGAGNWWKLMPLLADKGYVVRSLDLPGAGAKAKAPSSYDVRPLDRAAFASEVSPNAGVTQEDRTRAVLTLIDETKRKTHAPVILVGHCLGGVTITDVAEAIPGCLRAIVYVCGYMIPPGMPISAMRRHPRMSGSLVRSLLMANPLDVGALRVDPRSEDQSYRERMRLAFYADLGAADVRDDMASMHCDEPIKPVLDPSTMTADRFGRVPRHFVRTLDDQAVPIGAQDFMIAAVDRAMGNLTSTYTFASSHAPHLSQPQALAAMLMTIAG